MDDLLLRSGYIVDAANQVSDYRDIAISNGKITGVFEPGTAVPSDYKQVLDLEGHIITPGLIDLHVHIFEEKTALGIAADRVGVRQGVTTVVDAGSTGVNDFPYFLKEAVEKNETQVLSWINIASQGLCEGLSELADLSKLEPERTEELIRRNPIIRGIKARVSGSVVKESGVKPLEIAKNLARKVDLPVMVHIGNAPPALSSVLDLLEAGDVVTHAFHGKKGGILDESGSLIPEAERALQRGVLFDVGHGSSSFSFKTMQRAMELGIKPYSISTDIYLKNFEGPVYSLVTTMNKLLALGFTLEEVVEAATSAPAKVLKLQHSIGTLSAGTTADITVMRWQESSIRLIDSENQEWTADKYLQPIYTIKSGKVMKCDE